MRLIDADYLKNKLIHNCSIEEGGIPLKDFDTHQKILKLYPAIDAVPVVRCKECRHQRVTDGFYACHKFMGANFSIITNPNNYCSCGEKKENERNY